MVQGLDQLLLFVCKMVKCKASFGALPAWTEQGHVPVEGLGGATAVPLREDQLKAGRREIDVAVVVATVHAP